MCLLMFIPRARLASGRLPVVMEAGAKATNSKSATECQKGMGTEQRDSLTPVWMQIHPHSNSFTHDQVYATAT